MSGFSFTLPELGKECVTCSLVEGAPIKNERGQKIGTITNVERQADGSWIASGIISEGGVMG